MRNNGVIGFEWSFRPLEFCSKIILSVPLSLRTSAMARIAALILGILMCLSNLIINGSRGLHFSGFSRMQMNLEMFKNAREYFANSSDGLLQFVTDIISATFYLSLPFVHIIFMARIFWRNNWESLQYTLQEIQEEMKLTPHFYRACRKKSFIGIFLLILDDAVFKWRYQYDNFYVADGRWKPMLLEEIMVMHHPFPFLTAFWARLADITVLVVFVVITLTAKLLFEELGRRAETMTEACANVDTLKSTTLSGQLRNLCRLYDQVCQNIEKINSLFGIILLLSTAKGFAASIFEFYKILLTKGRISRYYLEFLHTILRFFAILMPSYLVTQQASEFGGSFYQLSFKNGPTILQSQLHTIILQFSQIPAPSITALDIVKLDHLCWFLSMINTAFQWGGTVLSSTLLAIAAFKIKYDGQSRTLDFYEFLTEFELGSFVAQSFCPNGEDYSPCYCRDSGQEKGYKVVCGSLTQGVTPKKIKEVFKSVMSAELQRIYLGFTTEASIPKDVFVNHRIVEIFFTCTAEPNGVKIRPLIHSDAFRSSRNVTRYFHTKNCDMSMLDLNFLLGFDQLEILNIDTSTNVHITNLLLAPPRLVFLIVNDVTWFDGPAITSTRPITNKLSPLRNIFLTNSDLNDDNAAKILNWILASSLNGTQVEFLDLSGNKLTGIPTHINAFSHLRNLIIDNQQAPGLNVLSALSLPISHPLEYLSLQSSHITDIGEAGAFKDVHIYPKRIFLSNNNLTRILSSVFERILKHLFLNGGMIALNGNPFNCSDICHLSWLVRDHRILLVVTEDYYNGYAGPTCANGTSFFHLQLEGLTHCP